MNMNSFILHQFNSELVLVTDELAQYCEMYWLQNQMCGQVVINIMEEKDSCI